MRWDIINELLEITGQRRFLEIGCQYGHCGVRVQASEKWGVDPHPLEGADRRYAHFFRGTSDEFFERVPADRRFDVVLVDGLHHADQVLRDVDNALRYLEDGGFIVLHDCNPLTEAAQRVPRQTGVWNGDCWKAMVRLRQRTDVVAFTVNTDHGVGVLRKQPNPAPLEGVPDELGWSDLVASRAPFLGLVPPDRWAERLGGRHELGSVAVVSAIFGGRDEPRPIRVADADECLMWTEGAGAPGWRAVRAGPPADPRMAARRVKTLALEHSDADVIVWVDGRIRLTGVPLRPLLRRALEQADIACFPHPWRNTVAAEARECAKLGLAPRAALDAQVAAYQEGGFPDADGLWNTMVVACRRTDATLALGQAWWAELERHTPRDQVSLPFVLWKLGVACGRLGADVYRRGSSPHFERGQHRKQAA